MTTLYVSDLDGTLLNTQTRLSDNTINIMNALIDKGMHFTIATARSYASTSKVIKGLHLKEPIILYNGAFLLQPQDRSIIQANYFSQEESHQILKKMIKSNQFPFVYAMISGEERVSYMEDKLHEGGLYYLNNRLNDKRFRKVTRIEELFEGEIFYITAIHEKNQLYPLYQSIHKRNLAQTIFHQELYRTEYWLECMPHGINKAKGIIQLKEKMRYDRIISFGDAINDIAMFEISDECYTPDNAVEELKMYATDIIGSNEEDGVALWLKENVKLMID